LAFSPDRTAGSPLETGQMEASFRIATSDDDRTKVMVVRGIVFCEEQGIPYSVERDEFDATALHVLGEIGDEPVAAGRVRECSDHAVLGRIAMRSRYRGTGIGHALTEFLISIALERGYTDCRMHAQAHLTPFYARHGFRAVGQPFFVA